MSLQQAGCGRIGGLFGFERVPKFNATSAVSNYVRLLLDEILDKGQTTPPPRGNITYIETTSATWHGRPRRTGGAEVVVVMMMMV